MGTTATAPSLNSRYARGLAEAYLGKKFLAQRAKRDASKAEIVAALNQMRNEITTNLGPGDQNWQLKRNLPVFDENTADGDLEKAAEMMTRNYKQYLPQQVQQFVTKAPTVTNAPKAVNAPGRPAPGAVNAPGGAFNGLAPQPGNPNFISPVQPAQPVNAPALQGGKADIQRRNALDVLRQAPQSIRDASAVGTTLPAAQADAEAQYQTLKKSTGAAPTAAEIPSGAPSRAPTGGGEVSAPLDPLRSMEQRMQAAGWNVQGLQKDGAGYSVAGSIDPATGQPRRIMVQPTGEMVRQDYEQRMGISQMGTQARPGQRFSEKGQAIMDRTPSHTVSAAANSGQVISGQKRMPNGDLVEDAVQLPGADRPSHVVEYDPRFDTTRRALTPEQFAANGVPQNASRALAINPKYQARDAAGNITGPSVAYAVNPARAAAPSTPSAVVNNASGSANKQAEVNNPRNSANPALGAVPAAPIAGAAPATESPEDIKKRKAAAALAGSSSSQAANAIFTGFGSMKY